MARLQRNYYFLLPERYYYGTYTAPYFGRAARSDEDIAADVVEALDWDDWIDASDIDVEVNNGVVTLTGTVDSLLEKRSAGDDACDVRGVVDVDNRLTIAR